MININLQQRTILGICCSLAALFGLTLLYTIWQWYGDWTLAHQSAPAPIKIASADEGSKMLAAITDAHLFGKAFADGEVPITSLQLRVTGIVKATNDQAGTSKAYISISGQPGKIYQSGDSLPYGVKVYEITPDSVILENDGKLEKLPLPRERLEFKPREKQESM